MTRRNCDAPITGQLTHIATGTNTNINLPRSTFPTPTLVGFQHTNAVESEGAEENQRSGGTSCSRVCGEFVQHIQQKKGWPTPTPTPTKSSIRQQNRPSNMEESTILISDEGATRVLTPPRRIKLLLWLALAAVALFVGFLASVSGSSSTVAWWSTKELHQSMTILQQAAPAQPTTATNRTSKAASATGSASSNSSAANDVVGVDATSRGVILCLHNGIASMGASLIRELRCLGNAEPIQVYHCFADELSAESRFLLTRNDANVEIIDVCTELLHDPSVFNGDEAKARSFRSYWIKPLALYHTRLQEVILLDADAILLQNPAQIRSLSGYTRTGTTFFHDRIHFMRKFFNAELSNGKQMLRHILDTFDYARFGLPAHTPSPFLLESFAYKQESGHEMDSSMVFVDKRRPGKAMDVLLYLILELRFKYTFSWGDKEAFWLAYELAQQEYFFSPWGLSLIDSVPNKDLVDHPQSMCGSMAHFVPTENLTEDPDVLYVNGKVLLDPFAVGIGKLGSVKRSRLFNIKPTHVTPRHKYSEFDLAKRETFECLDNMGSTPLPREFLTKLSRRRHHYFAAETNVLEALDQCEA